MPSSSEMYFLKRVRKAGGWDGWMDWPIDDSSLGMRKTITELLSLKLFLNVCRGTKRHFLLSLGLSLKTSAVSEFSFDMEMRTLILAGGPACLGPHSSGRLSQVES